MPSAMIDRLERVERQLRELTGQIDVLIRWHRVVWHQDADRLADDEPQIVPYAKPIGTDVSTWTMLDPEDVPRE